jgi:hypothetical protein
VAVEGHRWAIEDSFETAKNEFGLDHNESRSWHGWHRHVSLVMLAFAMMAMIRHRANPVLPALTENMFTPERLAELLSTIAARRQERTAAVDHRLASLKSQVVDAEDRLKRLYRGIEEGIVELDDLLRERIVELKADREKAQAAYDHAASQVLPSASIDPERIAAFSKLMRDLLYNGETPARKAYLRTLVGAIIVGDKSMKIVGSKEAVRAAILGKPSPLQNVRGLGPEWRATADEDGHYCFAVALRRAVRSRHKPRRHSLVSSTPRQLKTQSGHSPLTQRSRGYSDAPSDRRHSAIRACAFPPP